MRWNRFALLLLFAYSSITPALAQVYATPQPVVRTTSVPAMRAIAAEREIHERFQLGLQYESTNSWQEATDDFKAILALHPREPQGSTALYDLAIAQAKLLDYDEAASDLRAAIQLDPGFLAAMANLVAVDLERGDLREARSDADHFVAEAPDSARALYGAGIVALRAGDAQTARDDFGKLLQFNPSYALAYYDLGVAEARLSRYTGAERDFRQALALAPNYARASFALAVVLLKEGNRADARVAFERAANDAAADPALRNLALSMRDAIQKP